MRTVRRYALGVFLLLAFTFNSTALAAPDHSRGESAFAKIKRIIIKILDDAGIKPGLPPG